MTIGGFNPVANFNLLGINGNQLQAQLLQMEMSELQQLQAKNLAWADEYSAARQPGFSMPQAAQMPFGAMSPSMAYNMNSSFLSPSYYGGPNLGAQMGGGVAMQAAAMQQTLARLQQQMAQSQAYLPGNAQYGGMGQGIPAMMPGAGGSGLPPLSGVPGMPPGGGGMGMPGMAPGGGLGGLNGLSSVPPPQMEPGEDPATYQQAVEAWRDQQTQEAVKTYNNALQLESQLFSEMASVASSIIQNIR